MSSVNFAFLYSVTNWFRFSSVSVGSPSIVLSIAWSSRSFTYLLQPTSACMQKHLLQLKSGTTAVPHKVGGPVFKKQANKIINKITKSSIRKSSIEESLTQSLVTDLLHLWLTSDWEWEWGKINYTLQATTPPEFLQYQINRSPQGLSLSHRCSTIMIYWVIQKKTHRLLKSYLFNIFHFILLKRYN